ncbi:GDF2 factor, partial [Amia calva]|nr:GDF2 factor [Amia calva]
MRENQKAFQNFEQDSSEEQDVELNLNGFLENMKDEFLRLLNLSGLPQEHNKIHPPQFMIELYNRYATDKSSIPRSDIIRSFNIQDVPHTEINGSETKHLLRFNLSMPSHEEITMAELRLYTFLDKSARSYNGILATIKIYDLEYSQDQPIFHFLSAKDVEGKHHSWEAFEVTDAIKRWVKSGQTTSTFAVHIERRDSGPFEGGGFDISVSLKDNSSAMLIVFSDDLGSDKKESREHMKDTQTQDDHSFVVSRKDNKSDYNDLAAKVHLRRRRHVKKDYCRKTSLRVNFQDIGWDSWIVAPKVYDAFECRGVCYYPLTDDLTPSKHAIIQTLVNLSNPKKAGKACCVPTKLDPITVMYQDENGIITVKHLYEEMKVAECGCR